MWDDKGIRGSSSITYYEVVGWRNDAKTWTMERIEDWNKCGVLKDKIKFKYIGTSELRFHIFQNIDR